MTKTARSCTRGPEKKRIGLTPFYFRHRAFVLKKENQFQNQVAGSNTYYQKWGAKKTITYSLGTATGQEKQKCQLIFITWLLNELIQ